MTQAISLALLAVMGFCIYQYTQALSRDAHAHDTYAVSRSATVAAPTIVVRRVK